MYDCIEIIIDGHIPTPFLESNTVFEHLGLIHIPRYSPAGMIYGYTTDLKNLRINYYLASKKYHINNSLQKYGANYNYSDFTVTNSYHTIEELSERLKLDILNGTF